jgi:hypothetical protein
MSMAAAVTTTLVAVALFTCASTSSRVTFVTFWPSASSALPVMVTIVPPWPIAGAILVMTLYSNAFVAVVLTSVSLVTMTSPTRSFIVLGPGLASTMSTSSLAGSLLI